MKDILIVGAGKIGQVAADLLAHAGGDYQVTLADQSAAALRAVDAAPRLDTLVLDVADATALEQALRGRFAVLSAAPYHLTTRIAEAARAARPLSGPHRRCGQHAAHPRARREADTAFIPQCGLAPGFISIVAADLRGASAKLDSVHARRRLAGVPEQRAGLQPDGAPKASSTNTSSRAKPSSMAAASRCRRSKARRVALDGVQYEAFNTSGGLGTLAETLEGRVRTLNYRTIRYPGHAAIMKALLHDLRLRERRDLLKDILENALPATMQDVVVIFVTVSGWRGGRLMQETYARKIYAQVLAGKLRSGIQVTTAASACTMLDLLAQGRLPQRGFVRQEDVADDFQGNRFGSVYAQVEQAARPRLGRPARPGAQGQRAPRRPARATAGVRPERHWKKRVK
jgi:saccharopine dehydrogenase-like NADP-dependent oxidoreductase